MKVAICDDNEKDLRQLCDALKQYDPDVEADVFSTARELYESARNTAYDAVLLDIEMEEPNGYEIALRLAREEVHPAILFVTNSAAYAVQGYGIALRYLLKPLTREALADAMSAVRQELRNNRFTVTLDGISHVLDVHDILYAEVANHLVTVYTVNGNLTYRASLKEFISLLPERWFASPNQSFAVNLLHVRTVTLQELYLMDGTKIPISRRRQQEFLRSFHRFLGV